ncbi:MAG: hypothetical protein ACRD4X_12165 [Candidatus Acidiferrales bacterium]
MAEMTGTKCRCARCRIRSLMGPVVVIAIGVIFLAGEYTRYGFATLWPALLLIVGILLLAQAAASHEGHIGSHGS